MQQHLHFTLNLFKTTFKAYTQCLPKSLQNADRLNLMNLKKTTYVIHDDFVHQGELQKWLLNTGLIDEKDQC
jgi:hypothetical protein